MSKNSSANGQYGAQSGCYCGNGAAFTDCCGVYLAGDAIPVTAQQLMRSRYSAYVVGNRPYLLATWHPATRPSRVRPHDAQRWLGLRIKKTADGEAGDSKGTVEFVARFKIDGKGHRLHEISRFEKVEGRWYYLDGEHLSGH